MAKNEIDYDDEEAVLEDIAHALDIDPDELKISEDHGLTGFGAGTVYHIEFKRGKNGKEWSVVADYDQEEELAIAVVTQDLEEEPGNFNQGFLESHIDIEHLRKELESDVQNMAIEDLTDMAERDPDDFWKEYEREGFDAPEEDEDGELPDPDDSQIEELADKRVEDQLKDPMSYLEDIYSKEDAVREAIRIAGIDIKSAAQEAVDMDGAVHFLSSYDDNDYKTDSGLVYWRTN